MKVSANKNKLTKELLIMAGLIPFNKNLPSFRSKGFEDFYNMLDDFFSDSWSPRRSLVGDTFKIDVQEDERGYVIDAELPGVKKEEINLELNDGKLTIGVQKEENSEKKKKNYIHKERRFSSMQRSVYLADAKTEEVKAKLEDGVLKIMIPKEVKVDNTQRIEIE
jgi:HSP20 family protein